MPEPEERQRLQDLQTRLDAVKKRNVPQPRADSHVDQAHLAWRMVIELVAGLGIGFGIGYGLDYAFGTLPVFLVIFTLLGMAAGIKTMLRSATEVGKKQAAQARAAEDAPEGHE